jgi:hypothetical protein
VRVALVLGILGRAPHPPAWGHPSTVALIACAPLVVERPKVCLPPAEVLWRHRRWRRC